MPVTAAEVRSFTAKIRAMKTEAANLTSGIRKEVLGVVERHRLKIMDAIQAAAKADGTLVTAQVPRLSDFIRSETNAMIDELAVVMSDGQQEMWKAAVERGQAIARESGIGGAFFAPSTDLIVVAQKFTADYVRSIAPEFMGQVNAVLSRTALGGLTPFEAMKQIDAVIGKGGNGGVSYQAERIVRTEVQRIYDIALDSQIESFARELPSPEKLKKQWVSGPFRPGRREWHQDMDGEKVGYEEEFSNGLQFPRDPAGPPEETINCGCSMILVPQSLEAALE